MEKKKYTYDLTFEEVLEEIWLRECWYQGENFADGVVIYSDADGTGILHDFLGGCLDVSLLVLTENLYSQMYRRIHNMDVVDAERRV